MAFHFGVLPWHIDGPPRLTYRETAAFKQALDYIAEANSG